MKRILLAFLFLISHLAAADDNWNAIYSEGITLINEGKNAEALEKIETCINLKGNERDFWYWDATLQKGYALAAMNKYPEAIKLATEIIQNTRSNALQHSAYMLRMNCHMGTHNYDNNIDDLVSLEKEKEGYCRDSRGSKTIIAYIQDPLHFSLNSTKCMLIHNRLTYGKDDIKQLSPTHYMYNSFCWCGCPESKHKIKDFCDLCGMKLEPIPEETSENGFDTLRKLYEEEGLDFDKYMEALQRRGPFSTKIKIAFPYFAAINYPPPLFNSVAKTSCNSGCWMAKVAGCGWCESKFKDNFPRKIACQDFTIYLESKCYDCCKTKDDLVACTGPFGRLGKKLYEMWAQSGDGLAQNWQCGTCKSINEQSWPPYICRGCGRFKNGFW